MERKAFRANTVFESNTSYYADTREYHIGLADTQQLPGPCWYTLSSPDDPPRQAAFVLRHLKNVCIDLNGAKLVFHGRILPFALYDCENVILKNFSIDYDRPFFTQGTVTDIDSDSLTLEIPDSFRYRVEAGELIAVSDTWEASLNLGAPLFQPYDASTTRLSANSSMMLAVIGDTVFPQENPPCPVYQLHAEALPCRKVRLTGKPEFFTPVRGEIVAVTHEDRKKPGFLAENCRDLECENIRLLHISAMAFVANHCHNLSFRNFSCYADEETGCRIITVNADVLHGFHCTGRILVENCRFENMLDDALNFHGNYAVCDSMTDGHTITALNRSAGLHDMPMFMPGDQLKVYRGNTQEPRTIYTVESSENLPGDGRHLTITVREPLKDFTAGDIIESQCMPEIVIRNCSAGHARGGWRISSGKRVEMENCRLENTGIMFTGDTNYWFENAPVRDVTIRNNLFEHFPHGTPIRAIPTFETTASVPYYHSGIRILNNRFSDCGGLILEMLQTCGIEVSGNTYDPGCGLRARIENCNHVRIDD